ncbi:hypothetical protein BDW74DRAFT_162076 [Aspergillus multicolor]|uniref:uncharacterized protein n=1 Tax=Aspergillus multicolor TaxID=41759 RepID=UPI003CCD03C6
MHFSHPRTSKQPAWAKTNCLKTWATPLFSMLCSSNQALVDMELGVFDIGICITLGTVVPYVARRPRRRWMATACGE